MNKRSFASDNHAPVHEKVMQALQRVNQDDCPAYGDDDYTREAIDLLKLTFGQTATIFFVYNGTGANVTGLTAITDSYQAVLCADTAHINVDECGAIEKHSGVKLITHPTATGKLSIEQLRPRLHALGVEHHSQPGVISITQATELGTLYTLDEIRELADFAHEHGLLLHMDGARIANAAAALNVGLYDLTGGAGVDVLSFGGTKNGLMFGEAVIFFNPKQAQHFRLVRKQGMQLASKMRYIAAQFQALLTDDLWLKNACQANRMAALLASKVQGLPEIKITRPVEANAVFAILPQNAIDKLQEKYCFYVWDEESLEVRWMTSFKTTELDINDFVAELRLALKS